MNASKWNIGSVNVRGQAMFGDNNQMKVDLARLDVKNPSAVHSALLRLSENIENSADQEAESLSAQQKAQLKQALGELVEELKQPQQSQNTSLLRQCISKITEVAGVVPQLLSTALELKGLLGL